MYMVVCMFGWIFFHFRCCLALLAFTVHSSKRYQLAIARDPFHQRCSIHGHSWHFAIASTTKSWFGSMFSILWPHRSKDSGKHITAALESVQGKLVLYYWYSLVIHLLQYIARRLTELLVICSCSPHRRPLRITDIYHLVDDKRSHFENIRWRIEEYPSTNSITTDLGNDRIHDGNMPFLSWNRLS